MEFPLIGMIILILLDLFITLILTNITFSFTTHLKTKIKKGKDFNEFIMSKRVKRPNVSYSKIPLNPTTELIVSGMYTVIALLFFILHFALLGTNATPLIYLYLIPLYFIYGLKTNPDNITRIDSPQPKNKLLQFIFEYIITIMKFKSYLIEFNNKNILLSFHNFIKKFTTWTFIILTLILTIQIIIFTIKLTT